MYMSVRVRATHIGYHFKTDGYYTTMSPGFPYACERKTPQARENFTPVQYFALSIVQYRPNGRTDMKM